MTTIPFSLDVAIGRAEAAVREAGAVAMRRFRGGHGHWEKAPGQILTETDLEVNRLLFARLLPGGPSPALAWLSEESTDTPMRLDARRLWVVDPIDGTRSFAAGKPEFSITLALLEGTTPLLGIVHNPATGEFFSAVKGKGATLNGRPIAVNRRDRLEGAAICVSAGENRRRNFEGLFADARVSEIGSLAYKLALVAAGRFDAYVSWRRAHDWDIAGASLILEEAGARLSDRTGRPIALNLAEPVHEGLIAAADPLHRLLLETLGAGLGSPDLPRG